MFTETDKAYLAGFIDGEGTIVIGSHGKANRLSLRVVVANTNKEVLLSLQKIWGGCLSTKQPQKEGWKACSALEWATQESAGLLREVLPYLKIKKDQALVAMQFQKTMNPRANRTKSIPREIQDYREELQSKMHILNHKGTS